MLGWCVYYTCLKRLSTFFTIVAVDTDYCIWMTGSPPSTIRFHLLNAGDDDAIKLCIWFKGTHRKDVYKVNILLSTGSLAINNNMMSCTISPYRMEYSLNQ